MNTWYASIVLMTCLGTAGCARLNTTPPKSYLTVESNSLANTEAAQKKHQQALKRLEQKCDQLGAEQLLHDALIEDVSYGPAHNTLGKIYYDQQKFYLAAWEFDYAIKTMPDRAEPKNNLGLVHEAVGKLDQAILQYQAAHEIDPENPVYLGNYLRGSVRLSGFSEHLRPDLEQLTLLDHRKRWVLWAKELLAKNPFDQSVLKNQDVFYSGDVEVPALETETWIPPVEQETEIWVPPESNN